MLTPGRNSDNPHPPASSLPLTYLRLLFSTSLPYPSILLVSASTDLYPILSSSLLPSLVLSPLLSTCTATSTNLTFSYHTPVSLLSFLPYSLSSSISVLPFMPFSILHPAGYHSLPLSFLPSNFPFTVPGYPSGPPHLLLLDLTHKTIISDTSSGPPTLFFCSSEFFMSHFFHCVGKIAGFVRETPATHLHDQVNSLWVFCDLLYCRHGKTQAF